MKSKIRNRLEYIWNECPIYDPLNIAYWPDFSHLRIDRIFKYFWPGKKKKK